ncbi:hypothetical protein GJ496_008787 [Pomphorhynchus laevis]|nr:hypothetical protein GJ496_008787 [Pomphorhynchus laevis]
MVLAVTGRVEWEPVLSVLNDSHHFEHTTTITERGARLDLGLAVDYFGWEAILFRRNSINSSCTATFRFSIFSRTSGCLRNLLGSRSLSSGRSRWFGTVHVAQTSYKSETIIIFSIPSKPRR